MSASSLQERRANLLAHKARVDAQLELVEEMIREQEGGEATTVPAAAQKPKSETPAPKAPRPATGTSGTTPGTRPRLSESDLAGIADRLSTALLGGPMATVPLTTKTGVVRTVAMRVMKFRSDLFRSTGAGRGTWWELTEEGRRAVGMTRPNN